MRLLAIFACSYFIVGLLVTMLMDRFQKLEPLVFAIGVFAWPLVLPVAIVSGLRDINRRR